MYSMCCTSLSPGNQVDGLPGAISIDPVVIGRPFGAAKMCNMRRRQLIFYNVSVFVY